MDTLLRLYHWVEKALPRGRTQENRGGPRTQIAVIVLTSCDFTTT